MAEATIRTLLERRKLLKTSPETSVSRAAKLMAVKHVGAIAVVEDNRLVGIFTERDALFRVIANGLDPDTTLVADVMTVAPKTIGPDDTIETALAMMRTNGFRHVPVVEDGEPLGILSSRL